MLENLKKVNGNNKCAPKTIIINGVVVRLKSESKLMCFLGLLLSPFNPKFMTNYWTTLNNIVYAPSSFDDVIDKPEAHLHYLTIINHEKIHLEDQKQHPILFRLSYVVPPVMSYGRWYWERKAYLPELIKLYEAQTSLFDYRLEQIINALGGPAYLWTWPKSWMRKWFLKEIKNRLGVS